MVLGCLGLLCGCKPASPAGQPAATEERVEPKAPAPPPAAPEVVAPPSEEPPDEEEPSEPTAAAPDGCAAVTAELRESFEGEDVSVTSCRSVAKAQEDGFAVELFDVELDEPHSDAYGVLMLMTTEGVDVAFEQVAEQRSVPGNEVTYSLGTPNSKGGEFRVTISEVDRSFSTDGPEEEDYVEKSESTLVCRFAQRECEVE